MSQKNIKKFIKINSLESDLAFPDREHSFIQTKDKTPSFLKEATTNIRHKSNNRIFKFKASIVLVIENLIKNEVTKASIAAV